MEVRPTTFTVVGWGGYGDRIKCVATLFLYGRVLNQLPEVNSRSKAELPLHVDPQLPPVVFRFSRTREPRASTRHRDGSLSRVFPQVLFAALLPTLNLTQIDRNVHWGPRRGRPIHGGALGTRTVSRGGLRSRDGSRVVVKWCFCAQSELNHDVRAHSFSRLSQFEAGQGALRSRW